MVSALLIVALVAAGCAPSLQQIALRTPAVDAAYVPPAGDSLRPALQALETRLERMGVQVRTVPATEMRGAWGLTWEPLRLIQIQDGLSVNARFEVLAHEAAHLLQPASLDPAQREVFAEVVMVRVAAHYGYNAVASSGRYLGGFKGGFAALPLLTVDIERAVAVLTGARDERE